MTSHHSKSHCCQHKHKPTIPLVSSHPYFCPMCKGVESDQPGDCPKCGMVLEPNPIYQIVKKVYSCPMHPEVRSEKPGQCPKCGMDLEEIALPFFSITDPSTNDKILKDLMRQLQIGIIFTLPLVILTMSHLLPAMNLKFLHDHTFQWIQLLLATPVVLWAGWSFFEKGFQSVRTLHLNMFTLISLGVGTAYVFSFLAVLFPEWIPASFRRERAAPIYFEAAAVITVLVLLGQVIEAKARTRTSQAIQTLIGHAPKKAVRLYNGQEEEIPIEQVQVNDVLKVKPGEKIPVDGAIIEGHSAVDESMITGESMPIEKKVNDPVMSGSLNQAGSFLMKANRIGAETLLARIIQLVAEAQRSRAPIQQLADKVAAVFVPVVVLIALVSFIIWAKWGPEPRFAFALVNAVSVLIIACPCALGLATPMSIMVGIGKAAQTGILIRNAEALQTLGQVTTVVFDKTGTLTEGHPALKETHSITEWNENELLQYAASVEQNSEHPLAQAVVRAAKERNLNLKKVVSFQSHTGGGVEGEVEGKRIWVGKFDTQPSFINKETKEKLEQISRRLQETAHTVVWVTCNQEAIGILALADPIKKTTPHAIEHLHQLRLKLVMLTGDNPHTAKSVAEKLKIDSVKAEIKPEDKNQHIKYLQSEGEIVAMAGDGINDAPALAAADVGIAMGTGTDVAMESAAITLVKGDLKGVAQAIHLSRATLRNIRQNLFFAFFYNCLGVPIAAGVLYPFFGILLNPVFASIAMSLSSLCVIANALRLKRIRIERL